MSAPPFRALDGFAVASLAQLLAHKVRIDACELAHERQFGENRTEIALGGNHAGTARELLVALQQWCHLSKVVSLVCFRQESVRIYRLLNSPKSGVAFHTLPNRLAQHAEFGVGVIWWVLPRRDFHPRRGYEPQRCPDAQHQRNAEQYATSNTPLAHTDFLFTRGEASPTTFGVHFCSL